MTWSFRLAIPWALWLLLLGRGTRPHAAWRARSLRSGPVLTLKPNRIGAWLKRARHERRPGSYDVDLADALSTVARSLRSGGSFSAAIAEGAEAVPGPVGADLAELERRVELGSSWPDSLASWVTRRPLRSVAMAAGGLAVGLQTGTATARVLDGLVDAIRIGSDGRAEARALSSQARASVMVLVASPLAFLVISGGLGGGSTGFLFGTPVGWLCLTGGVLLDVGAAWWMRAIVRSVA